MFPIAHSPTAPRPQIGRRRERATIALVAAVALAGCSATSAGPPDPPTTTTAVAATTTSTTTTTTTAATADPWTAALQGELDDVVAAGVPGAVLLARHGVRTIEVTAGSTQSEGGASVGPDTKFRTGSVAKAFVATVMLQLVDEGTLSLDDTVERWLPGLLPDGDRITLRQVLGNRTGLYDFAADPRVLQPYLDGQFAFEWTPEALVAIAAEHPRNFAPGTAALYSNTDYTIAGMVIEQATAQSVAGQITTRLIEPLGLRSTSVPLDGELTEPFAHGYFVADGLQDVTALSPSMSSFGGNLVSTASDLATFFDALFGGRLLPPALLDEMRTTTTSTSGEVLGLGLQAIELPCGTFIGHTGSTPGFKAGAMTAIDGSRQFVVLINSLTIDDRAGSDAAVSALDQAVATAACGPE